MSPDGTGKSDLLPVKSKADAQSWAQQITEHMAQVSGVQINQEPARPFFSPCTGRNGESAPDDRYTLMYAVHRTVARAQHPEVVRRIRAMLKDEGLTIKSYRETLDGQPEALLYASHPESRYFVEASTAGGDDRMVLSVTTPCLMPPGAPQSPAP